MAQLDTSALIETDGLVFTPIPALAAGYIGNYLMKTGTPVYVETAAEHIEWASDITGSPAIAFDTFCDRYKELFPGIADKEAMGVIVAPFTQESMAALALTFVQEPYNDYYKACCESASRAWQKAKPYVGD